MGRLIINKQVKLFSPVAPAEVSKVRSLCVFFRFHYLRLTCFIHSVDVLSSCFVRDTELGAEVIGINALPPLRYCGRTHYKDTKKCNIKAH